MSQRESFIFFCDRSPSGFRGGLGRPEATDSWDATIALAVEDDRAEESETSESTPRLFDAGGPTGTIRDPNSTPIVTS